MIVKKHLDPPEADGWGCGLPHPHGSVGCLGAKNRTGNVLEVVLTIKLKKEMGLKRPRISYFFDGIRWEVIAVGLLYWNSFGEENRTNI